MYNKQQVNVWSVTLPTRFFRPDWRDKKSKPTLVKPSNPAVKRVKSSKNQFCGLLRDTRAYQPTIKTASILSPPSFVETSFTNRDFLPNQILLSPVYAQKLSSRKLLPEAELRDKQPELGWGIGHALRSLQNFFRFSNPVGQSFGSASLPVVVVHRAENNYEVWVNNRVIANLPNKEQARLMQQGLTRLIKSSNFDASRLRPALVDGIPALMAGNRFLFGIQKGVSQRFHRSGDLLAIEWINNLRQALQVPTLSLVEGQQQMYGLTPSKKKMTGLASWYGPYFHGRLTANGEIFNQNELTVAHKTLPFNTYLQVTNLKTGKAVIVRVNDRGPYIPPRSLDLSRVAARCINSEIAGVVPYKAVILQTSEPKMTLKSSSTIKNQKPPRKLAVISEF
ncbi:septal ring lytic transglycosylase RlpA family protein [Mastigocladopsis repens]|uniref:septal ring lytic transglycosylase RlpA family protein n=1 Tax=Mastigocladopsis repens TaxID=221287 RepID=UPI00036FBD0F